MMKSCNLEAAYRIEQVIRWKKDMSFEQFEHCSARVPIQARVLQNSYERIM